MYRRKGMELTSCRSGISGIRGLLILLLLLASGGLDAQDLNYGRRLFFEKANCDYCHGWSGDGSGQGQSPGGAANLRQSHLSREQLIATISCGVPGTSMPHFDELAYSDKRCFGMTEAELGSRTPALPPSTTLPRREIEVLADYLLTNIIGRGSVTREECFEKLGGSARSCNDYPPRP
jgi:hypothetical protein